MPWTPPPRSRWVDKLAAFGRGLGDDGRTMVPLTLESLRAGACEATGLEDFGDPWHHEPWAMLCEALDGEARLHLAGRVRTRAELQLILQNRLRLVDLWARCPEVIEGVVEAPVFVTGLGRSGTTLLHELLACDPANRSPLLWELLHTPPAAPAAPPGDAWVTVADAEITVMDEMVPAFTAMHENRGHLPTECIFAFAHQGSSDQFVGLYDIPSYTLGRSALDAEPLYRWHRQMLSTLQHDAPTRRWVLKAPSHLSQLDALLAVYPDARVVITHRDPLRVVGSLADMMATLQWMHSDHVDHQAIVEFLAMGLAFQMDRVTEERDRGALPIERIHDVAYLDLVADPIAVVHRLYERWGRAVTPQYQALLERYVADRHANRTTSHEYRFEDTGLDLTRHRAAVVGYQERFGVASEVGPP